MDKLVIAPVVQRVLGPSNVARLVDLREHTDTGCLGCGGVIPPEDPNPATVVVGVSENTVLRVNLAHQTCMASQIYDINQELDLPELFTSVSFVAYPILRAPPASPRAMIVFEFAVTLVIDEAEGDHQRGILLEARLGAGHRLLGPDYGCSGRWPLGQAPRRRTRRGRGGRGAPRFLR